MEPPILYPHLKQIQCFTTTTHPPQWVERYIPQRLNRTTCCNCEQCEFRSQYGLRPLPFFSRNHKYHSQSMRVLIFDTETTGLPKRRNASVSDTDAFPYIVQWSWMVYDIQEMRIVSLSDYIIRLNGVWIPKESTKIHGITNTMMRKQGRYFPQVLTEFIADYETCDYLVAHNLEFDRKMIQVECFRHHLPVQYVWNHKRLKEYCTMKQSKSICGIKATYQYPPNQGLVYIRFPKLQELHQILFENDTDKSTLNNLHNSLMDIIVCFRCFHMLEFEKDPFEYPSIVLGLSNEISHIYGQDALDGLKQTILSKMK